MWLIPFLWSFNAALALMFALVCALTWAANRQDRAKVTFCAMAIATAAATPIELGMMHAQTPAQWGSELQWYHLPVFVTVVSQALFVHYYLQAGRALLLWLYIALRVFVLVANFLVEPNYHFHEIFSLQHIEFLGEQVAVVGDATVRNWQWLAGGSVLILIAFVVDAAIQSWRRGGREPRRRALTVGLAIIVPLIANVTLNQLVVSGFIKIPICATLLFLGTVAVIGYELGREVIVNGRAQMQLASLRHEWAQVERVNSLGQLASALAHELSQPLAAILMNVDAARQQLRGKDPDLDELRATLDDTHKDGLRAVAIIERIRTFIKTRDTVAQSFALEEVAHDVTALLRHEATARNVDLTSSVPAGLPAAFGDRVNISQVMLNLLINAMDAVQDCAANQRQVSLEICAGHRDMLRVTVRDCGPGIPEGRLEEIFKPLVTTKPTGLGVGLALSRMIVDAHGGALWAENSQSGGAVFHFTLPQGPRPVP